MNSFMDHDFLLKSDLAKRLYHEHAAKMPIIDYHCHLDPSELARDRVFDNITRIWLEHDHYKFRLLRQNGVDEKYITGDASDYDKFMMWAKTLESAIGNPLYHWSHLELRKYFGYEGELNSKTADTVWKFCNEQIKDPQFRTKNIIEKSNVVWIGTTDDPLDTLEYHQQIELDKTFYCQVRPTFRPDLVMQIRCLEFSDYVSKLSKITDQSINTFDDLVLAMGKRMDHFKAHGCVSSDHGFTSIGFCQATTEELNGILQKALHKESISELECLKYETALLTQLAKGYSKRDWVMQLHFGVVRNTNTKMFQRIGKDKGYDRILGSVDLEGVAKVLDHLDQTDELPKTILYSLNPNDNAAMDTLCGCFHQTGIKGKVQHGMAWWFNDHQQGMNQYMQGLAQSGLLSTCVGMLTDSRSILSYARHEYFRRIMCDFVASKVENGEYAMDFERLASLVEDLSYHNTKTFFGL